MGIPGRGLDYYIAKDSECHRSILKSTQSLVFDIMLSSVTSLLDESRKETLDAGGTERANAAHRAIFEALRARDPDAAEEMMKRHLKNAEEDLAAEDKIRAVTGIRWQPFLEHAEKLSYNFV